jgi:hypothetical protein
MLPARLSRGCSRAKVCVGVEHPDTLCYLGRSSWDLQICLSGLSKITEETGGECFSLGTSNPVSFQPYLESLQRILDNQYFLVFLATPRKKAGLQRVKISTELSNAEIEAPDNVWVEAAK